MLQNFIYYILFISIFLGCIKEDATFNEFKLYNNSGVNIKIISNSPYDTIFLANNESKEIELPFTRGKSTGINYAPFTYDSLVIVIFNNSDTIVHYFDNLDHPKKYYNLTSTRNFYNPDSFEKKIVDDTKHLRTVTLSYTILPKDFEDAK